MRCILLRIGDVLLEKRIGHAIIYTVSTTCSLNSGEDSVSLALVSFDAFSSF